jgi:hypothetical protein
VRFAFWFQKNHVIPKCLLGQTSRLRYLINTSFFTCRNDPEAN